jgi:hypothetical protein
MADINLANLIYLVAALLLVALGVLQSRRGGGLTLGKGLAYLAIWAGLLLAVAFIYQTFPGLFRA